MRLEEALGHAREGKKIRCKSWTLKEFIMIKDDKLLSDSLTKFKISNDSILDDWEIFEKEKPVYLTFGEAIQCLKENAKIGRWRSDGIYIYLNFQNEMRVKTCQGNDCPWLPNHEEIFAENWKVIE